MSPGGLVAAVVVAVAVVAVTFVPGNVEARPGQKGLKPLLGWNTWCTQNKCAVDWCSSAEVLDVAQYIKASGMQALGYEYINLDDCWGVRDLDTHEIKGDPLRFPEGMKAFIAKIHALGFKFGLYTDVGLDACHSPFTGSYGHYEQDAATFTDWEVDFVKFDDCDLPAGHTLEELTCNMSSILLATGRDFWFNFHCWHSDTCAKCGTSFRVDSDHHDEWSSTQGGIQFLAENRQPFWGPDPDFGWPDPDFVFTGGQGCGAHSNPGVRCPGQSETEYISEFSIWAIAGGQIIIASDPRNMTSFQRSVWFNTEVLAVYNDTTSFQQISVKKTSNDVASSTGLNRCAVEQQLSHAACTAGVSYGCAPDYSTMWASDGCRGYFTCGTVANVECNDDGSGNHTCPCKPAPPAPSYIFMRPLSNGNAAVVMHNTNSYGVTLTVNFGDIPSRSWAGSTLNVRDVWLHKTLPTAKGEYSAIVPAHGVVFVILSPV